jgi:ABC-type antimicrobial peptide transport system permease subunit
MWMVTIEAMTIAFFGALPGVASGSGLGAAVVRALHTASTPSPASPTTSKSGCADRMVM